MIERLKTFFILLSQFIQDPTQVNFDLLKYDLLFFTFFLAFAFGGWLWEQNFNKDNTFRKLNLKNKHKNKKDDEL